MSYVRHKIIKGHKYFYLVYGERVQGKIKQRHVRYLGKHPWRYVVPVRFNRVLHKDIAKVQGEAWYERNAESVKCTAVTEPEKAPTVFLTAHEIGHVLNVAVSRSSDRVGFAGMRDELQRVTERINQTQRGVRAYKRPPQSEQFANLFALCVTQPRQAEKLAPRATKWLMKTLYEHSGLRDQLSDAGFWELDIRGVHHRKRSTKRMEPTKAVPPPLPVFAGFPDVTTPTLDQLAGRRTVSKQFIADLTRSPDMQRAERDILTEVLADMPDEVAVHDFADQVKTRLLPIERTGEFPGFDDPGAARGGTPSGGTMYESIALSNEIRGDVARYGEFVYQSPIKTSVGNVHFSGEGVENYFAHTRVEDMADGATRRVIEVQSDLFQKDRLNKEIGRIAGKTGTLVWLVERISHLKNAIEHPTQYTAPKEKLIDEYNRILGTFQSPVDSLLTQTQRYARFRQTNCSLLLPSRERCRILKEIKTLQPQRDAFRPLERYRNRWWRRIIHEEIKQAAIDGKTKLQFPTGETAMKIEGLVGSADWMNATDIPEGNIVSDYGARTHIGGSEDLRIGMEVSNGNRGDRWIITDVLENGKFKAIPKREVDSQMEFLLDMGGEVPTIEEALSSITSRDRNGEETFDLSGKIDTNNPIYKFYDRLISKYLQRIRPDMRRVTDPQGVEWFEIDLTPQDATCPVPAFGA